MLAGPLLLPPLLLAVLLCVSGGAKLRHPEETRSAFAQLQLPRALTDSPAPQVLPWAEIVLAVALVVTPAPFALGVAVATLGRLIAYLAVIEECVIAAGGLRATFDDVPGGHRPGDLVEAFRPPPVPPCSGSDGERGVGDASGDDDGGAFLQGARDSEPTEVGVRGQR